MSFRQVRWAQELFKYYFWIDYRQGKANRAADALSCFLLRDEDKKEKLWAENTQIFHCLQSSLTNATLLDLFVLASLLPLYQVLICGTHGLPQLRWFWNLLQTKQTDEGPYLASIGSIRLRLQELQKTDSESQELGQQGQRGYKKVDRMLHYWDLSFVPKAIRIELISRHHDNLLAGYFSLKKTRKLLAWKYFWSFLQHNVKAYVKGCNASLTSKTIRQKLCGDLQSLPIPTHRWKDLLIDFVTGLPISTNWKEDSYNSILVIVDWLRKMVHYKPAKITINLLDLAEVIIDVVICYHSLPDSIVTDRGCLFISKFWSLLCYFLGIKRRLFIMFHPQINGQTKRQNSTIEAYLQAFVNFE